MGYSGQPLFKQQELESVKRMKESTTTVVKRDEVRLREGGPGSGPHAGAGRSGKSEKPKMGRQELSKALDGAMRSARGFDKAASDDTTFAQKAMKNFSEKLKSGDISGAAKYMLKNDDFDTEMSSHNNMGKILTYMADSLKGSDPKTYDKLTETYDVKGHRVKGEEEQFG